MDIERLTADLKRDEGFRAKVYDDADGQSVLQGSTLVGFPTIGIGRNLQHRGITESEAEYLLRNDIFDATMDAMKVVKNFEELNEIRQEVIINMTFNMGVSRLLGFRNMRKAVEAEDFDEAAIQMLDSRWANQVSVRATRLAERMKTGEHE